jgi:NTP pyrophosphatase (non-canonical NTP hydrolase)
VKEVINFLAMGLLEIPYELADEKGKSTEEEMADLIKKVTYHIIILLYLQICCVYNLKKKMYKQSSNYICHVINKKSRNENL